MRGPVAGILLALTITSPSAAAPQEAVPTVADIRAGHARCRDADPLPGPFELMACDEAARAAAAALTARSPGTEALSGLLSDLFEPMEFALTGGEDALAARVVVSAAQTEFALRRAGMLTVNRPGAVAGDTWVSNPFEPLGEYASGDSDPAALNRRWIAINAADCAVYPVADCPARLDALMREMIGGTLSGR